MRAHAALGYAACDLSFFWYARFLEAVYLPRRAAMAANKPRPQVPRPALRAHWVALVRRTRTAPWVSTSSVCPRTTERVVRRQRNASNIQPRAAKARSRPYVVAMGSRMRWGLVRPNIRFKSTNVPMLVHRRPEPFCAAMGRARLARNIAWRAICPSIAWLYPRIAWALRRIACASGPRA